MRNLMKDIVCTCCPFLREEMPLMCLKWEMAVLRSPRRHLIVKRLRVEIGLGGLW